jgi:coatomer protein complex subunit gamma
MLSLQALEGTDVVLSNTTHTLKLYGKSISGGRVAALIKMAFSAKSGVTVKVSVRTDEVGLAGAVVSVLA